MVELSDALEQYIETELGAEFLASVQELPLAPGCRLLRLWGEDSMRVRFILEDADGWAVSAFPDELLFPCGELRKSLRPRPPARMAELEAIEATLRDSMARRRGK